MNLNDLISRIQPRIPGELVWAAVWPGLAVVILHAVLGELLGHEPWVDPVSHFFGGVAVAHFLARLVDAPGQPFGRPNRLGVVLLVVGGAALVALIWELGELASDLVIGTSIQISARNTLRDLAMGVSGSIAVCGLDRSVRRARSGA